MGIPQQSELRRSGHIPAFDPDAAAERRAAEQAPVETRPGGPVPADQQPGHHAEHEQDQPDLDDFARRLGVALDADDEPTEGAESSPRRGVARTAAVLVASTGFAYVAIRAIRRLVER